jgi:hypothetical protein
MVTELPADLLPDEELGDAEEEVWLELEPVLALKQAVVFQPAGVVFKTTSAHLAIGVGD